MICRVSGKYPVSQWVAFGTDVEGNKIRAFRVSNSCLKFARRRMVLALMPLYYVLLNTKYSINPTPPGFLGTPFALAVEAENDDDAQALILASFQQDYLSREKNFGEVRQAQKHKNGWILTLPSNGETS